VSPAIVPAPEVNGNDATRIVSTKGPGIPRERRQNAQGETANPRRHSRPFFHEVSPAVDHALEVNGNDATRIVSTKGHGIPRERRRSGHGEAANPRVHSRPFFREASPAVVPAPEVNGNDAPRIVSTKGHGIPRDRRQSAQGEAANPRGHSRPSFHDAARSTVHAPEANGNDASRIVSTKGHDIPRERR
jgi:hypothetical protein